MAQFTLFSDFPTELQDLIWDAAIRDDTPATQFFTLFDTNWDTDLTVPLTKRAVTTWTGNWRDCVLGIAAPRVTGQNRSLSWANGNASAYMIDSGLWTACWGSRLRMLWHFKPQTTSSLAAKLTDIPLHEAQEICQRPTATVTLPFQRDNGERQYLTIRPMQDLLYFHVPYGSPISSRGSYHWQYLQCFPGFRWRRAAGGWHNPLRVRNVAAKYDQSLGLRNPFTRLRQLILLSGPVPGDIAGLEGFWFVHYGLRRRYRVDDEAKRRNRKTFRAGDEWEFVEVLPGEKEWWDPSSGYHAADGPGGSGSHQSMTDEDEDACMRRMIREMEDEDSERKAIQFYLQMMDKGNTPRFGILAYVKRGSEKDLPTRKEWIGRG